MMNIVDQTIAKAPLGHSVTIQENSMAQIIKNVRTALISAGW
jgi:hypothetical protein